MTNDTPTPTTRTDERRNEDRRRCLSRRRLLSASGAAFATVGVAGCSDDGTPASDADASDAGPADDGSDTDRDDVLPDLPRVEDPPDAVYVPTHREAMLHLPTERAGEYAVTPMLTYPHRFWLVTGDRTDEVVPESPRGVHLMFTPWDPETGTVLPVDAGAQIRVRYEGDVIDQRAPWPMISQSMGFHFGDNVPLPEDGTYTVEVDLTSVPTRTTGAFDGRFRTGGTATFEFEYDETLRQGLIDDVHYFGEELWGERGAIDPMDHGGHDHHDDHSDHDHHDDHGDHDHHDDHSDHDDGENHHHDDETEMTMPFSRLPEAESYPGVGLGEPRTGDARVVVRYLEASRLADGADYLLVSPRTPYNRVPLADTAIAVDGAVSGALEQTLDHELGLHYGIAASLEPGDAVEVVFESPPQVSRHAGYETAFLEMPPVEVTVPE